MKQAAPGQQALGPLDTQEVGRLIAAPSDVVLVLDPEGVIRESRFRDDAMKAAFRDASSWGGRKLADTITVESRPKAASMIERALTGAEPKPRHLNHPASAGPDVAVTYAAVQPRNDGPIIAFGSDLRPLATVQQRLVDAQAAMARDYAALRSAQHRTRILFGMSLEPLLLLDADTLKVTDANEAAEAIAAIGHRAAGRPFLDLFEPDDRFQVRHYLAGIGAPGGTRRQAGPVVRLSRDGGQAVALTALPLADEENELLVARLLPQGAAEISHAAPGDAILAAFAQAPDGRVLIGADGCILTANASFAAMAQLGSPEQATGRELQDWLGQPGVELPVLLGNLRQQLGVRLFRTTVRGEHGLATEVELSAVALAGTAVPTYDFTIREIGRRQERPEALAALPRSADQLTRLIGRVPLKDLVRDATDVIERLCIEAALELTMNNRAASAELLGLSRQSLYVKLRKLGLGEAGEGAGEPGATAGEAGGAANDPGEDPDDDPGEDPGSDGDDS